MNAPKNIRIAVYVPDDANESTSGLQNIHWVDVSVDVDGTIRVVDMRELPTHD